MKNICLIICTMLCITTISFSADWETVKGNGKVVTKTRLVSSYQKISLEGSIDIIINQNGQEGVTIETDENIQDLVITEVIDGKLKINYKKNISANPTKMIVHVSCKQLNKISSSGSGDITSSSTIKTNDFSVSHSGSGDLKLNLSVNKLNINSSGSGDFDLEGSADFFTYNGAGSGDVMAKDLKCPGASISIAGSGDVVLKNGTKAKVSAAGSGDVSYE
jgi:hypothetical protein